MGGIQDYAVNLELRIAIYMAESNAPAGPRLWKSIQPCSIKFNFPATKEGMLEAKQHLDQLQSHLSTWNQKKR